MFDSFTSYAIKTRKNMIRYQLPIKLMITNEFLEYVFIYLLFFSLYNIIKDAVKLYFKNKYISYLQILFTQFYINNTKPLIHYCKKSIVH